MQFQEIFLKDSDLEDPKKSVANVFIIPDEDVTYIPPPRFEQVMYRGNIDDTGALTINDPTVAEDSFSQNISFQYTGDDTDLLSYELVPPYSIKVSVNANITEEDLIGKTFLTATITANHPEVASGSTVLLIDLPRVSTTTQPKPFFETSLTKGLINSELDLVIEDIVLAESSYTPETVFTMAGGNFSRNFVIVDILCDLFY